jgi:hypothetical protein
LCRSLLPEQVNKLVSLVKGWETMFWKVCLWAVQWVSSLVVLKDDSTAAQMACEMVERLADDWADQLAAWKDVRRGDQQAEKTVAQ